MHLVDRLRRAQRVSFGALLHPVVVSPLIAEIPNDRSRAGRLFVPEPNWVGFVDAISVMLRFDVEFIERAMSRAGDEAFPYSGRSSRVEVMSFWIPPVKASYHRYRTRVRRPYAEDGAGLTVARSEMRAHLVVNAIVAALIEEIEVVLGKKLWAARSIFAAHVCAAACAGLSL